MTAPFPKDDIEGSIPERFRRAARAHPNRPAVSESGRTVTYAELEARVAAVAGGALRSPRGSEPRSAGRPRRSRRSAALRGDAGNARGRAVLRPARPGVAGCAAPVDPARSRRGRGRHRRRLVGEDAGPGPARSRRCSSSRRCVAAPRDGSASTASVSPGDLAYVLFTSGSTGRPKGVMQSHRNVLHNVWKLASGLAIGPEDRITLLSSPSFGASVSDIYGALLTGACVCPFDLSGDGLRRLPDFLEREGVTIYHSVPSVFRSLSSTLDGRADVSTLRMLKLGGEAVLASDLDLYRNRFPRSCVFHVGLGSTEMAVMRQWFATHDTPWPGGSPLGYAVDGTEVVLLGEGRAMKERSPSSRGRCRSATGRIPSARPRPSCPCRDGPTSGCSRPAISAASCRMAASCISAAGTNGSRSAATASRPARSRPRSCRFRECAKPPRAWIGAGRRLVAWVVGRTVARNSAPGARAHSAALHDPGGDRAPRRPAADADGEGGPRGAADARDGPSRPRRGVPRSHRRGRGGGGRGVCAGARPRSRRRATTISSSSAATRSRRSSC